MGVRGNFVVLGFLTFCSLGLFVTIPQVEAQIPVDFHNDNLSHAPLPPDKSAYFLSFNGNGNARFDTIAESDPQIIAVSEFIKNNNGMGHVGAWNDVDRDTTVDPDKPRHTWPAPACIADVCNWTRTLGQMTHVLEELKSEELDGKNTKLFIFGFSFGGGAATFITTDIDWIRYDLVWLVDPVGPGTLRNTVTHECGTTQLGICEKHFVKKCSIIAGVEVCVFVLEDVPRVFKSNTKQVVYARQEGAPPPTDFLSHPQSFENPHGVPILEVIQLCGAEGFGANCHSASGEEGIGRSTVISQMSQMNKKPVISSPSEIHIKEGSSVPLEISAIDNPTRWDRNMVVKFRMEPEEDTEILAVNNPRDENTFSGVFTLGDLDGPGQQIREIQAEDNGFPCFDCTDGGVGAEAAKGSKGKWDRTNFSIIIDNVSPTIESEKYLFNGFEASIQIEVSDPSTADMQAGFDYEIDWGDGTVEIFHDASIATISHLYQLGEYQITITATDKDGGISEPNGIRIQTPFYKFTDNIDELVNDGTLNKGQGNSFNQKIIQAINSFEKANNIPACNKADAYINEVNAFVYSETFSTELGQELIEKTGTEQDKAGCDEENTFDDLENTVEIVFENNKSKNREGKSNENNDTSNKAKFFNVNTGSSETDSQTSDNLTDDSKGGGNEHLTRPTFGVSHETFETIVDSGFRFNDQSFTINDNHHTPFAQQTVNIGEVNTFEAKIYADKRLKVQEFLFGIPNVGEAHLAELGIEVWYDYNGKIEEVKAIQKSNVIDKETIVATHEKTKCQESDIEKKCDITNVSMKFLEPLKDQVMAVKAIDYKNRYQITYLNEGVDIAGESLNPMNTFLIPSKVKGEGLVQVTQTTKYSPYWVAEDGRIFEMNSFGSFKQIDQSFERFQDTGNPYTRVHSGFGGIIAYEQKRATQLFDSSQFISELPESFAYLFPESGERVTEEMKAKMLEQEETAKKILEESKVQARW